MPKRLRGQFGGKVLKSEAEKKVVIEKKEVKVVKEVKTPKKPIKKKKTK